MRTWNHRDPSATAAVATDAFQARVQESIFMSFVQLLCKQHRQRRQSKHRGSWQVGSMQPKYARNQAAHLQVDEGGPLLRASQAGQYGAGGRVQEMGQLPLQRRDT